MDTQYRYMCHYFRLLWPFSRKLTKFSYFCKKAYKLTNVLLLYIYIMKRCIYSILITTNERNDWLVLPKQQIANFQTQANQSVWTTRWFRSFRIFILCIWEVVSFLCFGFQYMKMSQNTVLTLKWTLYLSFSQWKKIIPIFGKVKIVHKFTCTCSVHILPALFLPTIFCLFCLKTSDVSTHYKFLVSF